MAKTLTYNENLIIENVNIVNYYNDHILGLKAKFKPMFDSEMSSITGLCPFHDDNDPSLHVWKKKKVYHCFGCGASGSVIRFHQRIRRLYYNENLTDDQVVQYLALKYGVTLDEEKGNDRVSVFEHARKVLLDENYYKKKTNRMSVADFRRFNQRLIEVDANIVTKINGFAQLDMIASLTLSNHTENK